MNILHFNNFYLVYAVSAVMATALWLLGMYVPAAILLLLGGGLLVARPHFDDARLILDGTPVLLLFAVMFIAASGMVVAVDRIGALFDSPAESDRCGAVPSRYVSVSYDVG